MMNSNEANEYITKVNDSYMKIIEGYLNEAKKKKYMCISGKQGCYWEGDSPVKQKGGKMTCPVCSGPAGKNTSPQLKEGYLTEKPVEMEGKKYFMKAFETHNKKYTVKMSRVGKNMSGPFVMDVVDVKSNKTEEKEFSSEREMKAYWKELHKDNLK